MDIKAVDKIFTITQAAKLCGLNRIALWRWIKSGKLQAYQTPTGQYKIKKEDLEQFVRKDLKYIQPILKENLPRILIVDDDDSVRKYFRRILSNDQYEIGEAFNGFQAGLKIMKFKPLLVILDLFMPEIDGFYICRQLKTDPATKHIKIIAISGYNSSENKDKILELGADVFLEKPINKKDLLISIKRLLSG